MVPIIAVISGLVLLGAVTIIVAVVAVVRKRRRNTGREGQGLSSLSAPVRGVSASIMGNTSTPLRATVSPLGHLSVLETSEGSGASLVSHRWKMKGLCSSSR